VSFFRKRARGYRAAFRVEGHRDAAERLRLEDPDTFAQIVAQADGSDAEAAAQRDPVAYVALFMAAAEDVGLETTD
jgi:hypothetical protein